MIINKHRILLNKLNIFICRLLAPLVKIIKFPDFIFQKISLILERDHVMFKLKPAEKIILFRKHTIQIILLQKVNKKNGN